MRNRPQISWDADSFVEDETSRGVTGESSALRCGLLVVILLIPLTTVAARLTYLQRQLGPTFVAAWEVTTTIEEPLPCRDGRILSADGMPLAQDRLRFDVLVHYRWLEEPADETWVKQRALAHLNRRERRDPNKVADAKETVLRERRQLWDRLAATTSRNREELDRQRGGVQRRVERIVQSVTERRDARSAESVESTDSSGAFGRLKTLDATPADFRQIKEAVVAELTAPPQRADVGPIVVAEELAHHVVIEDVDLRVVSAIESTPSLFPGVRVQTASERVYPAGDTAAHIVGVRTEVTPEELGEEWDDTDGPVTLQEGDRLGRSGIERALDQTLRGRRGTLRIVKDRRGEILSQTVVQQPLHGCDVVLTLDAGLQRTAERLLDDAIGRHNLDDDDERKPANGRRPNGGCLIAIDVRTGDVITAAAAPRFDLGLLLHPDPAEWQAATSDPRRPFFPRVTQMTVPPGSVFKILTAIALLESRLIDPNQPVFCQGYLDRPDRNRCYIYRHYGIGHGDMALSDAICQSCNVYFFHAARSLGPKPIADWAARFGLGVATGGEVPGEKGGHLPHTDAAGKVVDEEWYDGSTLQFAIGQASLTVTPLQVARMVAAVANDGYLVTPRFVREESDEPPSSAGDSVQLVGFSSSPHALASSTVPPVQRIAGLSSNTLATVRNGMRMVVDDRHGTGRRIRMDDVAIAGKTGTAEVGGGKNDHAWFVGFVPADAPRYAFVVVIEHGGSGGAVAAPIAKQFIEAMLDAGILPRRPDQETE